jgi:hypothetical protein
MLMRVQHLRYNQTVFCPKDISGHVVIIIGGLDKFDKPENRCEYIDIQNHTKTHFGKL